jgi:hypothetical protein
MSPQSNQPRRHHAPAVARVAVATLRDLRRLADGDVTESRRDALRRDLDYLIAAAEESARPLPEIEAPPP